MSLGTAADCWDNTSDMTHIIIIKIDIIVVIVIIAIIIIDINAQTCCLVHL